MTLKIEESISYPEMRRRFSFLQSSTSAAQCTGGFCRRLYPSRFGFYLDDMDPLRPAPISSTKGGPAIPLVTVTSMTVPATHKSAACSTVADVCHEDDVEVFLFCLVSPYAMKSVGHASKKQIT